MFACSEQALSSLDPIDGFRGRRPCIPGLQHLLCFPRPVLQVACTSLAYWRAGRLTEVACRRVALKGYCMELPFSRNKVSSLYDATLETLLLNSVYDHYGRFTLYYPKDARPYYDHLGPVRDIGQSSIRVDARTKNALVLQIVELIQSAKGYDSAMKTIRKKGVKEDYDHLALEHADIKSQFLAVATLALEALQLEEVYRVAGEDEREGGVADHEVSDARFFELQELRADTTTGLESCMKITESRQKVVEAIEKNVNLVVSRGRLEAAETKKERRLTARSRVRAQAPILSDSALGVTKSATEIIKRTEADRTPPHM